MASATILAPAPAGAPAQEREAARQRQALLDGYESFRRIIDGYTEDARPSVDDVESVLSVVKGALSVGAGQLEYQSASSTSRDWQFIYAEQGRRKTRESGGDPLVPAAKRVQKLSPLHMAGQGLNEGRTWFLRLSPGVMGLRCSDENRKEQARERQQERARKEAEMSVAVCDRCPENECPGHGGAKGEIMEWSARSRSRLSEMTGSLDYSEWLQKDGALAMVTLTLPGDWLTVAPDGKTFKKLLKRFELRWRRAGLAWVCLWKLEFQRRGAPHWHALMRVPALVGKFTFEEWLSKTWADCVAHPDPDEYAKHLKAGTGVDFSGKDFSDPRRISLYFLGHSAKTTDGKEYQHIVPEAWRRPGAGPGRFWGYAGLALATREIEITERDAVQAARMLRKVKQARAWKTAVLRERGALPLGEREKHRTFGVELRRNAGRKQGRAARRTAVRKAWFETQETGQDWFPQPRFVPSSLGAGGYAVGGWVLVNDALRLGVDLARFFELRSGGAVV